MLRAQILERKLLPCAAITEEAMARDIGISRATVREVLNTLTVEGLLTRSPTTRVLHVTKLGRERRLAAKRATFGKRSLSIVTPQ